MAISYGIDVSGHLVTITVTGEVTYEQWESTVRSVFADRQFQSGFDFLSDRRAADPPPTIDTVRRGVAFIELNRARLGDCRWAMVVSGPAGYGMGRMSEALAADSGVRVRVFTEMAEAQSWLHPEMMSD